ncbi:MULTISPECIES: phosphatase PAP2 family protein [unclassified Pseudonocardia]|uniref:phosphatase PAP2 family protein n=1 Tax=unclassified Pseudonocardia TaxID=2619320 RepID=UPI0001FFE065|nr:Membrane-associated phospholipid phosphatase [Pseudonocardia sp. Ae707_Ps1]
MADTLDRSGPQPTADAGAPNTASATGEIAVLATVQDTLANDGSVRVARGMSLFGEHAAGWLAIGLAGAALDRPRRREWLGSAAAVAFAHGASIGVKRVVRRRRPDHPSVRVLVGTPSRLSFPSSHATSTTAAAVLYGGLLGRRARPAAAATVGLMALSRLVLGVHYPTDVATGTALGAAVAAGARRAIRRNPSTGG